MITIKLHLHKKVEEQFQRLAKDTNQTIEALTKKAIQYYLDEMINFEIEEFKNKKR